MSLRDQAIGSPFRAVFGFVGRRWLQHPLWVTITATAMILATLTDVFMPVYAGNLINAVAQRNASGLAAAERALMIIAALGAAQTVLRFIGFRAIVMLTLAMMGEMARESFYRVQRFAADWHANNFAGAIVRKITRGIWATDLLNDTVLIALLPAASVLIGTSIMLGVRSLAMGLLIAGGAMIYVTATMLLQTRYVSPASQLSNRCDTAMGAALADAVSCNAVVKGFAAEAREDDKLTQVVSKWQRRTRRYWMRGNNVGTGQSTALLVLRIAIIGLALYLWWLRRASAGEVATVITAYLIVLGYLRDMGYHIANIQRTVNEMEDMVRMEAQPFAIADHPAARPARIVQGAISFEQVDFAYGAHVRPLFRALSVRIAPGERVGLVGHSGSGKTSFVKLIQRLHDVTGGRIMIDGQNIAQVTQQSLRSAISIVAQEPILFHRSLAENIAYGRPDASMAEIEQAAMLANAHDFIMRLPRGYRTLVGERGVKLSGGERQRVAIARAFLADAPILILDEATASLDSESEALIQQAVERLMTGRTVIVVAHRLSTVRALDRILVFDQGSIVEEGTHDALTAQSGGIYRRLFERQALGLLTE
ncbi:MAG TPA: ABC transporter ATP-binding protein [Acidiphilium sp.]|nr:MAG: multidrug ABC transporter ATP-binding protein [Acidiphilium sp. 21-60-14]OYV89864.1 MAG: multidrug ABC transporter ATP-binding protein [Acidiphilium sp. 37-60-79]OZB39537.1 MAG: multidrug ABC transporter ATP-binding protein [Acidiphilium sp. 34-60-192]HQT89323.1 ABC transporter ATP-binding protein [Acidiphilium sp.]HQU24395.1 ABC transporter ATP-binding protein [Acidiphilium sp.]